VIYIYISDIRNILFQIFKFNFIDQGTVDVQYYKIDIRILIFIGIINLFVIQINF